MGKILKLTLFLAFWWLTIFYLYKNNLLTSDIAALREIIGDNVVEMKLIFILLSVLRILSFIPQSVFVVVGGAVFGPFEAFLLSMIALFMSQSMIYAFGRYLNPEVLQQKFLTKHATIIQSIRAYGYKLLALGIACPYLPSDAFMLSAGMIKLTYRRAIFVTLLAGIPIILLYSFLGIGIERSWWIQVIAVLMILAISYYSILIWKKIKAQTKNDHL